MNELIEAFIQHIRLTKTPSTAKRYVYDMQQFLSVSQDARPLPERCATYIEQLVAEDYSISTIRRLTSLFNQLLTFADYSEQLPMRYVDQREMTPDDFLTDREWWQLIKTMRSFNQLSERQKESRRFVFDRNLLIVHLLRKYGLTLKQLQSLQMKQLHLGRLTLQIDKRQLVLTTGERQRFLRYFSQIDETRRPRFSSTDPVFVAFHPHTLQYMWNYEKAQPKQLTAIAIQKMIKLEVRRANLRPLSAHQMRNEAILRHWLAYGTEETVRSFQLKNALSLRKLMIAVEQWQLAEKRKER